MFANRRLKSILPVLVIAFLPALMSAQQRYLYDKLTVGTGANPIAVASGDFNNDGRVDLVTANQGSNSVSVVLGRADGSFNPKTDYGVGTEPVSVAVGDFNGDGNLDIAVANSKDNTVSILIGTGTGGFQPHVDYSTGLNPRSMAIADLNGDGKLDLVTANVTSNSISVLLNNGDGTFGSKSDYATGLGPQWVILADFNGDHKLDVAVANSSANTVSVLLGDGAGKFGAHSDFATDTRPVSIAAGDLNRDGKMDLVVAQNLGKNLISGVGVLLGRGDGTFQPIVQYTTGSQPAGILVADVNADSIPDVVVSAANTVTPGPIGFLLPGGVSVFIGKGDGTLTPQVSYATGAGCSAVIAADVNRDGVVDLVTANVDDNSATVLAGQGGGKFSLSSVVSKTVSFGLGVGDFNHDGAFDLVTSDGIADIDVFFGTSTGKFLPGVPYGAGRNPELLAVGDYNRDGNLDVAVLATNSNTQGTVFIFLGNSDGTFTSGASYSTGIIPISIVTADFNQDGILDMAFTNLDSFNISVMFGNGDGTFQPAVNYPTKYGQQPVGLVAADFNNDHFPDLAFTNNLNRYLSMLLNDGTGHFGLEAQFTTHSNGYTIVAGDVNHDGNTDLFFGPNGSDSLEVFLGNGDGTFQPSVKYSTGNLASISDIKIVDVDGDGNNDVVAGVADYLSVLRGKGDGTFDAHNDFLMPRPSILQLAMVDFTGYHALDATTTGTYGTMILRNNPVIALDPNNVKFGTQKVGTTSGSRVLTISSSGIADLQIKTILLTGANSGDFSQSNNCAGSSVPGGESCSVTITFTPQAVGARSATVLIGTAVGNAAYAVSLSGTGK